MSKKGQGNNVQNILLNIRNWMSDNYSSAAKIRLIFHPTNKKFSFLRKKHTFSPQYYIMLFFALNFQGL